MPKKKEIMIGVKNNRLTILKDLGIDYTSDTKKYKAHFVECQCECGNMVRVNYTLFANGRTKSCGCLNIEKIKRRRMKHKGTTDYPRLYSIWKDMRKRCHNEKSSSYNHYGAKGITVCDEWENFESFKEWSLSNVYFEQHDKSKRGKLLSIDRIDSNKNYSPENCQWITLSENIARANSSRYKKAA